LRRFLVIVATAFWLGGFSFYGGVVIHIAHQVLVSHVTVGFVTRRVTNWLNVSGGVALVLILWNLAAEWRSTSTRLRATLAASWLLMAVTLAVLFALHPVMDRVLDPDAQAVLLRRRFRSLHQVYLAVSTVQWAAGLIHLWCLMVAWHVVRPATD
jgi:hypothetical protein